MNPDQQFLRTTLLPGLVASAEVNHSERELNLIEYGHIYSEATEQKIVAGLVTGATAQALAKGIVQDLCKTAAVTPDVNYRNQITEFKVADQIVAELYPVPQLPLASYFSINISRLSTVSKQPKHFALISDYPAIELDISIEVNESVRWSEIESAIQQSGGKLLTTTTVFDVFRGGKVPADKKALGIRFTLQSGDRTLTMTEAEAIRATILKALTAQFSIKHRY